MSFLQIDISGDESEYFCINCEDSGFTSTIGCIEDMLMDDQFIEMQNEFLERYWSEFEDTEENKLEYMQIFEEYQETIEHFIETYLRKYIDGFQMDTFIREIIERKDELDGEIFEMLFTFTDFLTFKQMFLDYKSMKEGKTADLSNGISIVKISASKLKIL